MPSSRASVHTHSPVRAAMRGKSLYEPPTCSVSSPARSGIYWGIQLEGDSVRDRPPASFKRSCDAVHCRSLCLSACLGHCADSFARFCPLSAVRLGRVGVALLECNRSQGEDSGSYGSRNCCVRLPRNHGGILRREFPAHEEAL